MIRLDAIPITGLPQVSKADVPGLYAGRVNCVLHSGQLSEHQELEVLLNGVLQTGVREEDQIVFTWQFFQASDEVRIALLSRGMRMKHWQGCWNERDAILHAGTLEVAVFFDGKPQPLLETTAASASSAAPAHVSSSLTEIVNGSRPVGTVVLERNQDEDHVGEGGEAPRGEQRTVIVQDLLVIAASGQVPDVQQEREVTTEEDKQEKKEIGAEDNEREDEEDEWVDRPYEEEDEEERWKEGEDGIEDDDVTGWEEEEMTDREEMEESDEVQPVDDVEVREAVAPPALVHDLVEGDEQHLPAGKHVAGRCIAAFHASPLDLEKTLQSLRDLLATMPSKTLIVDVRPKDRQKKKYQEQDALSKQLLRVVFGAKYWDRCWAIQIVSQVIPPADRTGFSTWRYVVDKPESHPDGIPSLVKKLEEGYSIVVMDSIASYAGSRRRAVIDDLQQRVSGLDVGSLG